MPFSKGDMVGLDQAILDVLRAYVPVEGGVCNLDLALHCTLPMPDWHLYAWAERVQQTVTAASSAAEVFFTVPNNERVTLQSIYVERISGDNTINILRVVAPPNYFGGLDGISDILYLSTAAAEAYWPDVGGKQGVNWILGGPRLLEPGTTVGLVPSGAGASNTVWAFRLDLLRSKIVRSRVPYPDL